MMRKIERQNTGRMCAGQDLVVAGNPGLAGAAFLTERFYKDLLSWFSPEYLDELIECSRSASGILDSVLPDLASEITEMEPVEEGGILKAVWNLTGAYETGVRFVLRSIPLTQGTIEICERFELNPYRLYSSDCMLLTAENGGRLVKMLEERQIPAQVIGEIKKGPAREMIVQDGQGFLERPQKDEILKVIKKMGGSLL